MRDLEDLIDLLSTNPLTPGKWPRGGGGGGSGGGIGGERREREMLSVGEFAGWDGSLVRRVSNSRSS